MPFHHFTFKKTVATLPPLIRLIVVTVDEGRVNVVICWVKFVGRRGFVLTHTEELK